MGLGSSYFYFTPYVCSLTHVYCRESLVAILQRAVEHCPQVEELWLRWAKERWNDGDVFAARDVLSKAFIANPESESIWLAAVKLEAENGELGAARQLLDRARTVANTQRVNNFKYLHLQFLTHIYSSQIWMKSAVFERQHGDPKTALALLSSALKSFPKFAKLYMIQGQIHQDAKDYAPARASYAAGMKACPKEPVLWILASRLEEADGKSIKARALLDKARVVNPGVDILWAEAYGLEERAGGATQAKATLSRGRYLFLQSLASSMV
jgi:pre-mRNA-processing factor 6